MSHSKNGARRLPSEIRLGTARKHDAAIAVAACFEIEAGGEKVDEGFGVRMHIAAHAHLAEGGGG